MIRSSSVVGSMRNPLQVQQPEPLESHESRLSVLTSLKEFVESSKLEICSALKSDLGKSQTESIFTEILPVVTEIDFAIANLKIWMEPKQVTPAKRSFGDLHVIREPLGRILIISPWNYPFQLSMTPLINAIAAGNSAVIKPSEHAPHTSALFSELLPKFVLPEIAQIALGGCDDVSSLMKFPFDHIFFTGSQNNGKAVLSAAAENLTPVTLELGGKCPCIVEADTDLEFASRRIVWGKFINAGQTCVAPDYILVHESIQDELCQQLNQTLIGWFGDNPKDHPEYGRIVNQSHFNRLRNLVQESGQVFPTTSDESELFIPPTILPGICENSQLMSEEIFGPFLPILTFQEFNDAIEFVNSREKALAVYLFSNDQTKHQQTIAETRSGGCCVNDVVMQITDSALPFGGVGKSGMGRYHGKAGFDTFSNLKSIFINENCIEDPRMYRAYRRGMNK